MITVNEAYCFGTSIGGTGPVRFMYSQTGQLEKMKPEHTFLSIYMLAISLCTYKSQSRSSVRAIADSNWVHRVTFFTPTTCR